jgi:hypothetical protein
MRLLSSTYRLRAAKLVATRFYTVAVGTTGV